MSGVPSQNHSLLYRVSHKSKLSALQPQDGIQPLCRNPLPHSLPFQPSHALNQTIRQVIHLAHIWGFKHGPVFLYRSLPFGLSPSSRYRLPSIRFASPPPQIRIDQSPKLRIIRDRQPKRRAQGRPRARLHASHPSTQPLPRYIDLDLLPFPRRSLLLLLFRCPHASSQA